MGNPVLKTVCFWPGWDRVVDIYIERKNEISENLNDDDTCKIILLEKGEIQAESLGESFKIKSPALLMLSNKDRIEIREYKKVKITTVYFKPSVIREEFEYEKIAANDYTKDQSKTIFHDYYLIVLFFENFSFENRIFDLSLNEFNKIRELIGNMEKQLSLQEDGFWPCRSRSFLMELLYFISYSCTENPLLYNREQETNDDFANIVKFLNEHINENISLDRLTKEFSINRNKLNELFLSETSLTCLNYLTKIRIDLAKIMLANTEITVSEVAQRVGYPDSNYFARTFKKQTGSSPTEYRRNGRNNA
ncbi:MAG: AraC family transcriptional regulator [Lachnospiraceae bacterium]|nr:AraC family transcriptional regulator [Lachnospiraceae bacterium]